MLGRLRALHFWKPLEGRSFRRLWAGAGLSMIADQAFLVALTWLVLRVSGSGAALGLVLAVASIPGTILTPAGGVLSDRYSPVLIMIWASAGRILLLALLTGLILADATQLWHVYVIAASLSALDALYYPASMSIVPSLVDRDRLGAANALTHGTEQASSIFGPALAGGLLALLGLGASFGATAVLFLISTALFGTVARAAKPARAGDVPEEDDGQSRALASLIEGIRYVWRDGVIRSLLLILLCTNLAMMGPLYVGGAVLAESRLGGAGAFGTLVGAAGVGALIGVAAAGSIRRFRRRGLIELGLTGLLGVIVGAIAFVPNLVAAIALATAIGATASFLGVITISWLQERTEPGLLGRVMSFAMFSAVALDPISFALAGILVELDLTAMFLAAGALLLLTALLGALSRTMREVD
ncbi:MAG: MFS transporter [Rubrobacteraceae bacterium]|nr:MFS transporter [Rubrobacteraceae bacterium]MBA3614849.1 MFS transporter [Rubrobacteraceae bacterium]